MKNSVLTGLSLLFLAAAIGIGYAFTSQPTTNAATKAEIEKLGHPDFVDKAMEYLVAAQFSNGGWGAGMHAAQNVRDPKAVKIDLGTTAFATMALIRSGSTLNSGPDQENVRKALDYMLTSVEEYSEQGHQITDVTGTQPQRKLGQNIDASFSLQLFTRVMPLTHHDAELEKRVGAALEKCAKKVQRAQGNNGSTAGGTWAGRLQSSAAANSLNLARRYTKEVQDENLDKAVDYQVDGIDADSETVATGDAAGIQLYTVASAQRNSAVRARKAKTKIEEAKKNGKLDENAEVTEENLAKLDVDEEEAEDLFKAYRVNTVANEKVKSDAVLSGFGNNGGEEYFSYLQSSEALLITGMEEWEAFQTKMSTRLEKIQNQDGSWNGHHCITSPVFCTAAALLMLTADRDYNFLTMEASK